MSDILLAKPKLPDDWIDFSVGEPHIVREVLSKVYHLTSGMFPDSERLWEYPSPNGYKPLVDYLENKHQAPVIITNGAKQALGASFYALKQLGKSKLGMRTPFWALIPPLATQHGLICTDKYDSYLCLLPNNPDGFIHSYEYATYLAEYHKDLGIPFIHDAAYYTHVYLPDNYLLGPLGDVQIFSISKMYGLSGLRLGYAVCYNTDYYKYIQQYMETMTVGVSSISQKLMYDLYIAEKESPHKEKIFIRESRELLMQAKLLIRTVKPAVLEVPDDIENTPGMFGWFRAGPKADFARAKVNVIDGALFGVPGMVRLNLALPTEKLQQAIIRLNSL